MPYRHADRATLIDFDSGKGSSDAALLDTDQASVDTDLAMLAERRGAWARLPPAERLEFLEAMVPRLLRVGPGWVAGAAELEVLAPEGPTFGEEWLTGPALALHYVRQLARSLRETIEYGRPRLPGTPSRRPSGEIRTPVFPRDSWDRLFFPGLTAEAWLTPDVDGSARAESKVGGVCLVLGGGNVTAIPVLDALGKLFVDDRVVLLKLHRLTTFLEPLLNDAFKPLVDAGFLRIVSGGAGTGRELVRHPGVDEIHVTGSDRTYEAIVFGDGPEGAARKARGEPLLHKPVSAELGNVSPVIVVPGDWSPRDVATQAEQVASMLTNNAGFNCVAARVVITPAGWSGRAAFLDGIRAVLAATPTRRAWYPGAQDRFAEIADRHAGAERFGLAGEGRLPWAFITGLDPAGEDEPAFRTETFCSVFAETSISATSVPDYLDRAVRFANERLWGTLSANVIVDPAVASEGGSGAALERAIADLRYGTVAVNYWSAFGFGNGVSPWGAYPGSTSVDIQSGVGFTHNALMLDGVRKSIIRGPFHPWPKPPYFASHRTLHRLGPALAAFEARPGFLAAARLAVPALRG